ncbi:hypothetical protein D3C84_1028750 [compost metagenome]
MLDMVPVSDTTIGDLNIKQRPSVRVRIGVKEDAVNKGGVNLFGKHFGDHEQEIQMKVHYVMD